MDTNDKNTIDEDDDDDEDEPKSISSSSRLPSRLGSFTFFASSGSSSSDGFTSFMVPLNANSLVISRRQFSRPIESLSVREIKDGQEDTSIPTPLPPHPISRMASHEGQGQQQTKTTADEMKMQIEVLQTELEQVRNENKRLTSVLKDGVQHLLNDNESYQSMENDLTCKSEISEEFKAVSKNHGENTTKNEINQTLQPNETNEVPVKSNNPEIPISKLFKKHSYNKTEFNQEDFLNSLLSSPPLGAREHGKGLNVSQDMKFEGLQISNRNHQGPKQFSDEAINNLRSDCQLKENVDSDNEIMEDGVFENKFHEDITEVTLPSNPNIPHTRSLKTPGYEYERQDVWGATKTDRKSDRDAASPSGSNSPAVVPSGDSANPPNLPLLKYPDPSPTTGVHHATQLPPKRKSQELPVDGSPNPVSEYDEDDIGYQEYSQSNRNAYSKVSGSSHYYSSSRYTSYMASLQSLADHNGYLIKDVTPDGNCMFSAIIDQLRIQGNFDLTPNSLRRTAVDYLRKNPENQDGTHLESFLSTETWEEYLKRMGQESQWGDHMVLQACTEVTGQRIVVFKPNTNKTELVPTAQEVMVDYTITLGHIGESHFVSLRPTDWEATWPLKAHAHRARMKEKKKLARKKKLERQKSKEGKDQSPDVPEKDESTAAHEKETAVTDETEGATGETIKEKKQMEDEDDSGDEEEENNSQFKTTDGGVTLLSGCDIDKPSGVPCPHLQFVTRYLIPPAYIRTVELDAEDRTILSESASPTVLSDIIGSVAEGLCVELKNFNEDTLTHAFKRTAFSQRHSGSTQNHIKLKGKATVVCLVRGFGHTLGYDDFYLDSTGSYPGYIVMRPVEKSFALVKYPSQVLGKDDDGAVYFKFDASVLSGLVHEQWPQCATDWDVHHNVDVWPGSSIVQQIRSTPCVLLSQSHPFTEQPGKEWQITFPFAEMLLAHALTPEMKSCFSLFKVIVDYHTHCLKCRLKTTHLKTVMYDACETLPVTAWRNSPAGCLLHLLDLLILRISSGVLANYFVQQNNMINHLSLTDRKTLEDRLKALREFPLTALVLLAEGHGIQYEWLSSYVFEDCERFVDLKDITHTIEHAFIPSLVDLAKRRVTEGAYDAACTIMHDVYSEWSFEKYQEDYSSTERMVRFFKRILRNNNDSSTLTLMNQLDKKFETNLLTLQRKTGSFLTLKDIVGQYEAGNHADVFVGQQVKDSVISMIQYLDNYAFVQFNEGRLEDCAQFLRSAISKGKAYIEGGEAVNEYVNDFYWVHGEQRPVDEYTIHSTLLVVFSHLMTCYTRMGQIGLIQEYIEDYQESCDRTGGDFKSYLELESLWRVLGNPERADAIMQKLSSWEKEARKIYQEASWST